MYDNCYACGEPGHRRAECPGRKRVPPAGRPTAPAEDEYTQRYPDAIEVLGAPRPLTEETRRLIDSTRAQLEIGNGPRLRDRSSRYERTMWEVRGEPRTQATFGKPHPGDFMGGLPKPREYPA